MKAYEKIMTYRNKTEHLLVGMMSGTSLDGIDAALVKILTDSKGNIEEIKMLEFSYLEYTDDLRDVIIALCSVESAKLNELVNANMAISEWYAIAVERLVQKAGVDYESIDAVCSHGQTIWHAPDITAFPGPDGTFQTRSTLQIGDLSVLAERTQLPIVGNFRTRDMAAGGEGAPLVPFLEQLIFSKKNKGIILQNIGGIGNATIIPSTIDQDVFAFDTGPGNIIIDGIMTLHSNGTEKYDQGGRLAAKGRVNQSLLDEYLKDPYFKRKPPKSTGREFYGIDFAKGFLDKGKSLGLTIEDIVSTATALTAKTLLSAYHDFVFQNFKINELIISGGGAHNQTLLKMIQEGLPTGVELVDSSVYDLPSDAKEAIAFAVLGHETLMGRPSNIPKVTGANRPVILGNVCW